LEEVGWLVLEPSGIPKRHVRRYKSSHWIPENNIKYFKNWVFSNFEKIVMYLTRNNSTAEFLNFGPPTTPSEHPST